jgi:AraC-like DNA-binding protein
MDYREILPTPPLDRYLECFWVMRSRAAAAAAGPERILPDGRTEIVFHFGRRFRQHGERGPWLQPREILAGQMRGPLLLEPTGAVEMLGLRFRPYGMHPLIRVPAEELTAEVLPLGDVLSGFRRQAAARLGDARTVGQQVATLERLLMERAAEAAAPDALVVAAVGCVLRHAGQISISALARQAGVSCRHLERKFLRHVGLEPKLFSRIVRFQSVFCAAGEAGRRGWAAVALECGYYDQAHFVKECREFAGLPPQALFRSLSPMAEQFTRKDR